MERRAAMSGWFIRAVVILLLATAGTILAFTGLVLYFAPSGPQSGQTLVLGLPKHFWNNLHTYTAFSIIGFASLHIWLNRRSLKFYLKRIASPLG